MPRLIDLTGQQFGLLKVVECTDRKKNRQKVYKCLCECGKETFVRADRLQSGAVKSCGCYRRETAVGKIAVLNRNNCSGHVEHTHLSVIASHKPNKNNTSGVRGVHFDKQHKKWRAHIQFQGRKMYLGYYDDVEAAAKARARAEEEIFDPILARYGK